MTQTNDTTHHTVTTASTAVGEDVTITCDEGYAIEVGGEYVRELTLTIERHKLPIPDRRYMLGGELVKVASWHYDDAGVLWVVADDGRQVRWDA